MEKFGHAGPYPTKIHDNAVASMMCYYMQQINKITRLTPILALYFRERWVCPDMSDHNQQILHDLNRASMDI